MCTAGGAQSIESKLHRQIKDNRPMRIIALCKVRKTSFLSKTKSRILDKDDFIRKFQYNEAGNFSPRDERAKTTIYLKLKIKLLQFCRLHSGQCLLRQKDLTSIYKDFKWGVTHISFRKNDRSVPFLTLSRTALFCTAF